MASAEANTRSGNGFPVNSQFHVLLVEDDRLTLRTVEQLLRKCGYLVTTATNGREAIEVLEGKHGGRNVDIILTDVLMPEVNGMELINAVVQENKWNNVPVIVMSSQESQECVLEAFQAGASDYLIKPVRRNELTTLWQHVWKLNRLRTQHTSEHVGQNNSLASTCTNAQYALSHRTHNPVHMGALDISSASGATHQDTPLALHIDTRDLVNKDNGTDGAGTNCSDAESPKTDACGCGEDGSNPSVSEQGQEEPSTTAVAGQPQASVSSPDSQPLCHPTKPHAERSSPSRTSGATPYLPPGLQELAEIGHRREREREQQHTSSVPFSHGDHKLLRHSESTSAFTAFTVFLPKAELARPATPTGVASQHTESTAAATTCGAHANEYSSLTPMEQCCVSMGYPVHAGFYLGQPAQAPDHIMQFINTLQRQFQEHRAQHSSDQSQSTCNTGAEGPSAPAGNSARRLAVQKYLQKRKNRDFKKKVRYESRKRLAETRPRIRGQFVRQEVAAAYALVASATSGQVVYHEGEDDMDEEDGSQN